MKKILCFIAAFLSAISLSAQPTPVNGVNQLVAGTNITLSPTNGRGTVTVTAAGGGGTPGGSSGDIQYNNAGAFGGITPGTGVVTALGVNVGSAGAPVLFNGAGGTPSSIILTNATGTAASLTAGTASAVAVGGITGLGTGIATALAINTGTAGAPVILNGAGGTPSSLTLTNATALPVAGITASTSTALGVGSIELGAATDTTLARVSAGVMSVEGVTVDTISAANTLTNKTLTSPTLTAPVLGTPASGTLTNCTALPVAGITASTSTALGVGSIELGAATDTTIARVSAGVISVEGVTVDTISASNTLTNKTLTSPTLTTPVLGTPSSGTLTNCTGLPVAGGGTGAATLTIHGVVLGNTTSAVNVTAAGAAETILTGNGAADPTFLYPHVAINSRSAAYTTTLTDQGNCIYHPAADTTARTWTIDSNANVAAPIGTSITFMNDVGAGTVTLAITTDTLVLSPAGTTGSITLLASHTATALKVTSTRWICSMN